MGLEIERKFLVRADRWQPGQAGVKIMQGYLSSDPERTVRVRVKGNQGFLTVKGLTRGSARAEFEYPVPARDAEEMLELLALKPWIAKTRHLEKVGDHVWEIDVFEGENAGLVVAEIELSAEDEDFARPDWAGQEVTHDPRYFNSALAQHPFRMWGHK